MPSYSCSRFLNLPISDCLSFDSSSQCFFTSSSSLFNCCLTFCSMETFWSISSSCLIKSEFSAWAFLLDMSMSFSCRLHSDIFLLISITCTDNPFPVFSAQALALDTSSVTTLISSISCLILTLSFSTLDLSFPS